MGLKDFFGGGGDDRGKKTRSGLRSTRKYLKDKRLKMPKEEDLMADLESAKLMGQLEAGELAAYERIKQDPRLRQAMMEELEGESELARTGKDSILDAQEEQSRLRRAADYRSKMKDIQAREQQQGRGGSSFMAKMQALESSRGQAADESRQALIDAENRRRGALQRAGQRAQQIGAQDFSQDMTQKQAEQYINQFNLQNQQNITAANLKMRQDIENQRAAVQRQQALQHSQAKQQAFQNRFQKAQAQIGVQSQIANAYAMDQPTPSPFETAMKLGATGASIYGGLAGIGASKAATEASQAETDYYKSLTVEDGAVIHAEDGAVAGKDKLAKLLQDNRVRDMYGCGGVVKAEDGVGGYDSMSFGDAFKSAREAHGRGREFDWRGDKYTTNLKGETGEGFSIGADKESQEKFHGEQAKAIKINQDKKEQADRLAIEERMQKLAEIEAKGKQADKVSKGLGALGDLLSPQQSASPVDVRYQPVAMPENIMANPPQMADGGYISEGTPDVRETSEVLPDEVLASLGAEEGMDSAGVSEEELNALLAEIAGDVQEPGMEEEMGVLTDADIARMLEAEQSGLADQEVMEEEEFANGGIFDPSPHTVANRYADGGTYEMEDGTLEFESDGSGDIVDGESFERDRVDAKLNSGEMVINAAQQQRLLDIIRGKETPESIGEEDIVEGVPQEFQQDLMSGSGKKDKKKKQSDGLKKLLEMLGE
jgi:hypothetical protein